MLWTPLNPLAEYFQNIELSSAHDHNQDPSNMMPVFQLLCIPNTSVKHWFSVLVAQENYLRNFKQILMLRSYIMTIESESLGMGPKNWYWKEKFPFDSHMQSGWLNNFKTAKFGFSHD